MSISQPAPPFTISALDGNFTTWSTTGGADTALGAALASNIAASGVWIDEAAGWVYMWDTANAAHEFSKCKIDGTSFADLLTLALNTTAGASEQQHSLGGKYVLMLETTGGKMNGKIDVTKNGAIIASIDKSASFVTTGSAPICGSISSSGKYIAIFGEDSASSVTKHLVLLVGS